MRKGVRFALLTVVALALPVVVTMATYAIAAKSLAPTSWLALSVDSRRIDPPPGTHPSPDADRSQHTHRHSGPSGSSNPAPGRSGTPTVSPSGHPAADDNGGDARRGTESPGDGGGGSGSKPPDD